MNRLQRDAGRAGQNRLYGMRGGLPIRVFTWYCPSNKFSPGRDRQLETDVRLLVALVMIASGVR